MARTCQLPGCGGSLEGHRADAKFCNEGCAREHRRRKEHLPEGEDESNFYWMRGHWRRRPGRASHAA